jgi:hypothetical protein
MDVKEYGEIPCQVVGACNAILGRVIRMPSSASAAAIRATGERSSGL